MRFAPGFVEYQADRIAEGDDDAVSIHIPAERENGQKRLWEESMERERERERHISTRDFHTLLTSATPALRMIHEGGARGGFYNPCEGC
jgi:hypothetical protein